MEEPPTSNPATFALVRRTGRATNGPRLCTAILFHTRMRTHRDPTETVTARLLPNWKLQPFAPERIRRSSIDRRREDARGDSECVAEHVRKMSLVVESGRERHAYGAALAFLEQAAGRVGAHRKDRAPTSPRRMRVSPATIAKEPISARHSTTRSPAIACWRRSRRPRQPVGVKRRGCHLLFPLRSRDLLERRRKRPVRSRLAFSARTASTTCRRLRAP